MGDDFLQKLRAEWHGQDTTSADLHARLRRTRWRPHALIALELAGAAVGIAVGVWFARVALDSNSLLFAMSAAVMLLAVPALAVAAILARKDSLRWEDETPASVLRAGLRRAEASMRAIRVGRWHIAILLAFVVSLWITQAAGLIDAQRFLVLYSAVCAGCVMPYAAWLRWRGRRVAAERAACHRLLDDLEAEARGE